MRPSTEVQGRLRLALDALALIVAKASFIGLRLIALYLLAGSLPREVFGLLALAFTISEIARYVGDWGTDTLSLRVFSRPNAAEAGAAFRWLLRLRAVASSAAMLLALAGIAWLCDGLSWPTRVAVALTASTSLWLNAGVNWLQARESLRPVALVLAVVGLFSCCAQWLAAQAQLEMASRLALLLVFEVLMAVIVLVLALRNSAASGAGIKVGTNPSLSPNLKFGLWFAQTTPIAVASVLALLYSRVDQLYLRHFAEAVVLGDYSLAVRLVEPFAFVAAALSSTIYARASAAAQAEGVTPATRAVALGWVRRMLAYGIGVGVVVGLAALFVLPLWLPTYAGAIGFLCIGLLQLVFRCLNLCITALLQALGRYQTMMRISFLNAGLVPLFVVVGGQSFGPVGVAVAMVLAEAINAAVQWRLFHVAYRPRATL